MTLEHFEAVGYMVNGKCFDMGGREVDGWKGDGWEIGYHDLDDPESPWFDDSDWVEP